MASLCFGSEAGYPGGKFVFVLIHACKSWELALKYVTPGLFLGNKFCEALGYLFNRLVTII